MQSARYFCPIVTKSEALHIFIKVINIKFHRNRPVGAALTHVDEHPADTTKLLGAFRNYANTLKNV